MLSRRRVPALSRSGLYREVMRADATKVPSDTQGLRSACDGGPGWIRTSDLTVVSRVPLVRSAVRNYEHHGQLRRSDPIDQKQGAILGVALEMLTEHAAQVYVFPLHRPEEWPPPPPRRRGVPPADLAQRLAPSPVWQDQFIVTKPVTCPYPVVNEAGQRRICRVGDTTYNRQGIPHPLRPAISRFSVDFESAADGRLAAGARVRRSLHAGHPARMREGPEVEAPPALLRFVVEFALLHRNVVVATRPPSFSRHALEKRQRRLHFSLMTTRAAPLWRGEPLFNPGVRGGT